MKNISIRFKLLTIFAIPTIALLYFSYYYLADHYKYLQQEKVYKLSAQITNSLSKLLLNVQVERGLSAGYLVSTNQNTAQLKLQYTKTDKAFQSCLKYHTLITQTKKLLRKQLHCDTLPYGSFIVSHLNNIEKLRQKVLTKQITFEEEMSAYTAINQNIIELIDYFTTFVFKENSYALALRDIQHLKEYSGQERAYIYHELLSQSPNPYYHAQIRTLIELSKAKNHFKIDKYFADMRNKFFHSELTAQDAKQWFDVSTKHINSLEFHADKIIHAFISSSQRAFSQASLKLKIAIFVLIIIYIILVFLLFFMLRLFREDEYHKEKLHQLQLQAQHEANHDALTGIANRKQLLKRLHEEYYRGIRHHFTHAFLFIDLDNFKAVNDTYGHAIGDALLIEVSKRLGASLRQEDFLARISGDEFAVMLLNLHEDEDEAMKDVEVIAQKMLNLISQPVQIEDYTLHISLSIGIKLFPDAEYSVDDIVAHADTAMYEAKKGGKNRCVFYESLQG